MMTLVIGGAASGKSEFAEGLSLRFSGPRVYIATMQPFGEEALARIQKHRDRRARIGFETLECYTGLAACDTLPENASVLLECLGNLVANERYSPDGGGEGAALAGVLHLADRCRDLVVVTNEVFSGGSNYEGDTLGYLRELAAANRALAARADRVVELTAGLPNWLKGGPTQSEEATR